MAPASNGAIQADFNTLSAGQPEFDSDQAARLQDLAKAYEGAQPNGAAPISDFAENYAYPVTGLANTFQEVDDPAALLESLANYEHAPIGNEGQLSVTNDHFASLLQAAATAGGEENAKADHTQARSTKPTRVDEQFSFSQPGGRSKRKRQEQNDNVQQYGFVGTSRSSKRQKQSVHGEDEEQLAREREIWGPEEDDAEDGSIFEYQCTPIATSDARAAGVHSAAALFRRPSSASKKYTRPPMSKLFTSLELTPEQFLHLQAAAKAYMLDENHPERSDCVGNRGRGDTDMVKLKLFGCVKTFLEDEGWGDRCFGTNAPGGEARKLRWPQMKNKIIALVTPLLRRMVTNERQRVYALETRKGNIQPGSIPKTGNKQQPNYNPVIPARNIQPNAAQQLDLSPRQYPELDPKLNHYHYDIDASFASEDGQSTANSRKTTDIIQDLQLMPGTLGETEMQYHVNIVYQGRRIKPRFTLTRDSCPGFPSLVQHLQSLLGDEGQRPGSIKVLGADGLIDVADEESWMETIAQVKEHDWMDGEVRIVVHVETAQ